LTPAIEKAGGILSLKSCIRYSEAFKEQVLRELEEGKFKSVQVAARAYGIRGGGTIQKWIRRNGRTHLLGRVIRVETPQEVSEVKQLRQRVRNLEKALADAHLDQKLAEAYLAIACESAGIEDVEAFKKNKMGSGEPRGR
jgi:transposase-like protein